MTTDPRTELQKKLWRDKRSAFIVIAAIGSVLFSLVSWDLIFFSGTRSETRANPIYWLELIPFAYWASQLASYTPNTIRFLKPALWLAPLLACASLVDVLRSGGDETVWIVLFAGSALLSGAALVALKGSLLGRSPDA